MSKETLQPRLHDHKVPGVVHFRFVLSVVCRIKERISTGVVVIEAVIGFGVVTAVVDRRNVLVPTVNCPFHPSNALSIGFQRIAKEDIEIADKPLRLLEVLPGILFFYRKTLTPLSWGVLLYELLYSLNTLTGGSLADTLADGEVRMVFASLLRENRMALRKAARNGAWRPDFSLSCSSSLTVWLTSSGHVDACWVLEMLLSAPNWLFNTARVGQWYFNVPLGSSKAGGMNLITSPGQCDLLTGRPTCNSRTLEEIIASGERVSSSMDITKALLESVKKSERAWSLEAKRTQGLSVFTFTTSHVKELIALYNAKGGTAMGTELTTEFRKYSMFCVVVISLLCMLFYGFIELLFYEFELEHD
jgi:hypothetical protein